MKLLRKLQRYMTGRKPLLPIALIVSALSAIVSMVPYVLIWFIIREFVESGFVVASDIAITYAWWTAGSAIAGVVFYFMALSCSHLAAFRVETNMRKYAMGKIVKMPLGFYDKNTSGRIRKIIDENASITHSFLAHQLPDMAATVIIPVAAILLIFIFDWRLGLVCLIPIIASMFLMSFMMGKRGQYFMKNYMNSLEKMNTEAVEYVRGVPVVKIFQQTVYSFKNFYNSIENYKKMVMEYTYLWKKSMSAYVVLINGFVYFLIPAAIIFMSGGGDYGKIIVNLLLYVLVTPVFSQSVMRSMYVNQAFGQANEALSRMENLVSDLPLSVSGKPVKVEKFNIDFRSVSFQYPGTNKKAVDDVSFAVPQGQRIALVGASGGGKTSIARLVPRFWDVCEGEVSIGGVDVRRIDPKELMNHVSFVFQNTRLFKMSIYDNIVFGIQNVSSEAVERAIDLAQCRDIIEALPDGVRTEVGTKGIYLSGGEQQRIVLARAILKNAPIVVLDEATAFADPENEHLIQKALNKLTRGKTVLMIAHRLTSVKDVDRILVVKDGKIAESGTHDELLINNGLYTKMWYEYQQSAQWKIGKDVQYA